jgi:hypothetical protein
MTINPSRDKFPPSNGSIVVRSRRLELPRPFGHSHLKAARLPFRHDRTWKPAPQIGSRWQGAAPSKAFVPTQRQSGDARRTPAPSRRETRVNQRFTLFRRRALSPR